MKKKKQVEKFFQTAHSFDQQNLTKDEIAILIKSTQNAKHRVLLEFMYGLGLDLEQIVHLRLNEIDLISGLIYSEGRFLRLPKRLHNLIRFYLQNNDPGTFLLETPYGALQEEAAEKIIQTLSLRSLGKSISSLDLKECFYQHQNTLLLDNIQWNTSPQTLQIQEYA